MSPKLLFMLFAGCTNLLLAKPDPSNTRIEQQDKSKPRPTNDQRPSRGPQPKQAPFIDTVEHSSKLARLVSDLLTDSVYKNKPELVEVLKTTCARLDAIDKSSNPKVLLLKELLDQIAATISSTLKSEPESRNMMRQAIEFGLHILAYGLDDTFNVRTLDAGAPVATGFLVSLIRFTAGTTPKDREVIAQKLQELATELQTRGEITSQGAMELRRLGAELDKTNQATAQLLIVLSPAARAVMTLLSQTVLSGMPLLGLTALLQQHDLLQLIQGGVPEDIKIMARALLEALEAALKMQ